MSGIIEIISLAELQQHLRNFGRLTVVAEFHDGAVRPYSSIIHALAAQPVFARLYKIVRINAVQHADIAAAYNVTELPSLVVFREGKVERAVAGADNLPTLFSEVKDKLKAHVDAERRQKAGGAGEPSGSGSGASSWLGAELPRGYKDVTDQIEHKRVELLNVDSDKGHVRVLFAPEAPSTLSGGKGKDVDWVESDTDEQLLLFMPFQSMLKLHTLQITSIPPTGDDFDEDETPMRPASLKLYTNRPHNLGFDQAESTMATQDIEISESDWNNKGTANIPLRFVKFQNINSLVIFVVSGKGSSEKVRIDRLRLIGESGEKREMGKLEKIGDEPGE